MTFKLSSYRHEDLIAEVERRTLNGSDLISKFPDGTYKVRWWGDYRAKVRKGSKRHLFLKYAVSDDALIFECLRRVEQLQSHEFFRRWELMVNRTMGARVQNMLKDALGEVLK